ncbi:MAG: ATP synthase F1 subunit delta [Elusimicrobia bacterium]|nr:ATP synthase F1 subunit delta [Elusimicrobiota bacterium]
MNASDRILAARYATALFDAAVAAGSEERVAQDLASSGEVVSHPEAAVALKTPRVGVADKKKLLKGVLEGRCAELGLRFLDLLVDRKRLDLLPAAADFYGKLLARKRKVSRAEVRCARALEPGARAGIKAMLDAFSGDKVELDVKEDPGLLGGVVVRLGDWVMDASLRGELGRIERALAGD